MCAMVLVIRRRALPSVACVICLALHPTVGHRPLERTDAPYPPLSPDARVAADAVQLLSGPAAANAWAASSATWAIAVNASVPGDLLSDLQRSGVIGDPWFELGFLNTTTPGAQGAPLWDVGTWVYTTTFAVADDVLAIARGGGAVALVCDGIKMAADVSLDGTTLGFANDQFLRFSFPVAAPLGPTATLRVSFSTSRDPRNAEVSSASCALRRRRGASPAVRGGARASPLGGVWRRRVVAA